ncbi:MAG: 3D domain-containing protein [bacterium]|jgi:3D (Asp-Asp-Asp) domain-containing protein
MKRVLEKDFLVLMVLCIVAAILSAEVHLAAQYRRQMRGLEATQQMINELRRENETLRQRMQDWLNEWDVTMAEVTAYAPLDPEAEAGMCYAGNPRITASGALVQPGITAAAGPDVPFGTKVWVAGAMREVQDRGGRIGNGNIDICVATREEAFRIGRQRAVAVFRRGLE